MTKAELNQENTELKLGILKAHEALQELRVYLQSPKFYKDPTVQASDVLRRLNEVKLTPDDQVAKWSAIAEQWDDKKLFRRLHPEVPVES